MLLKKNKENNQKYSNLYQCFEYSIKKMIVQTKTKIWPAIEREQIFTDLDKTKTDLQKVKIEKERLRNSNREIQILENHPIEKMSFYYEKMNKTLYTFTYYNITR